MTRSEYLAQAGKPGAFEEYYSGLVRDMGGPEAFRSAIPFPVDKIRAALAEDPHMNNLPLPAWDMAALQRMPFGLDAAMRAKGDYPTLSGRVCLLKQAARMLAEDAPQP